ncbi:MAG: CopD family protein [Rhodocyclaceae bacterium]|nr:CopD family protein [Rhodocyclaceae bacterium]
MNFHNIALFLHLIGVIVWVGGMAFAYVCLRPAAGALSPADRLSLWRGVFQRFFPLVWVSIGLILFSGIGTLVKVGFAHAPMAWHVMMVVGLVMIGVYVTLWLGPWPQLKQAVEEQDWARGAKALNAIRQRVALNLGLGAFNVATATLGLAF